MIATDPAIDAETARAVLDGPVGVQLDATSSASIGAALRQWRHGAEDVCGVLGVIVVLVAGSIWRKRAQQSCADAGHARDARPTLHHGAE